MRRLISLSVVSLALAGCVAPIATQPVAPAPVVRPAPTPAPTTSLDAATRAVARDVVNREMAKRLPGRNVAPYTDCVVNNATMAELVDIAARGVSNTSAAASAVATIVQRPATTRCIATVAASA